jgi:hypothetical protein
MNDDGHKKTTLETSKLTWPVGRLEKSIKRELQNRTYNVFMASFVK